MSDDLAAFVTAQLDRIEAVAKKATPGPWMWEPADHDSPSACGDMLVTVARGGKEFPGDEYEMPAGWVATPSGYSEPSINISEPDATHIAQHDPAFVLAWVAAVRTVVGVHGRAHHCDDGLDDTGWVHEFETCPTLLALAQPFRGLDGWRDEWTVGE